MKMLESYKTNIRSVKKQYFKAKKEVRFAYNKFQNIIKLSKTPYYSRLLSLRNPKQPLKRSLSGFEIELMLIDNDGKISNTSEKIIHASNKEQRSIYISKEVGKQMIELHSFPSIKVKDSALNLVENTIKVAEIAEKSGSMIYPFANYPGRYEVIMHQTPRYIIQSKILGDEIFKKTHGSLCGFHFHYTQPRGTFNHKELFLKKLLRSKVKHSFMDCYNTLIAADPVLTTFMQSSPFVDNRYFAKDSRIIMIRGGKKLGFPEGLFGKKQLLGALPPYKHTMYDLSLSLRRKDHKWRELVEKSSLNSKLKDMLNNKITLDYIWNPVKINKLGTFEQRGMDTNLLSYVIATGTLIRVVLRAIQNDRLVIWPSDIGMSEPFKIEGNLVYIPPHSYVRNKLQKYAAYEGIKNKDVFSYCSKYFKFAKKLVNSRYHDLLKPIENIIEEKKTMSDIIIEKAKKAGYGLNDILPDEFVREFALHSADEFKKDLFKTEELLSKIG